MSEETKQGKPTLDEIIAEVRRESVDDLAVGQAAQRVWARLAEDYSSPAMATGRTVEKIRGCADFQALAPAYFAGTLSAARSLLLEDHVHGCAACRHALEAARSGVRIHTILAVDSRPSSRSAGSGQAFRGNDQRFLAKADGTKWGMAWVTAAVLLVGVGLGLLLGGGRLVKVVRGPETQAVIQTVDGALYQVSDRGSVALPSGGTIQEDEEIRTAKASSAFIRLVDGSTIEMNERTGAVGIQRLA